jgi:hypothetical protein
VIKVSAKLSNAIVSRMVQEGILKFSANGKQKLVVRDAVTTRIYDELARKYNKPVREEDLSQITTPESKKKSQTMTECGALRQKFHDVLQVSRSDLQMQSNNAATSLKRRGGDLRLNHDSASLNPKVLLGDFQLHSEENLRVQSNHATLDQDSTAFQQARVKLGESSFEPFAVAPAENSKKMFQKARQKHIRDDSPHLSCSQNALLNDDSVSLPAQPMFLSKKPRLKMSQ